MDKLRLGHLIEDAQQRDAIHIAVAPMIATAELAPGQHVGVLGMNTAGPSTQPVGVVDPFLKAPVPMGRQFWLFLYPGSITALRHEWLHPAFPIPDEACRKALSRAWIEEYAAASGQTYDRMMAAAAQWIEDGEYTYDNSESYKDGPYYEQLGEFWTHYEIMTGTTVKDHDQSFFTCSC